MRKIDEAMCEAVKEHRYWKSGNTEVNVRVDMYGNEHIEVRLHDNLIWKYSEAEDMTEFTLAGWDTPTTRTRLRALGVNLARVGGVTYYGGVAIDRKTWYELKK